MSKSHIINLHILNKSGGVLIYSDAWFQTGRLADGNSWPASIANSATAQVECCESDWSPVGCSGWVKYTLNGAPIYFAFSNPVAGKNGIDVGTETNIWDGMGGHLYPVERPIRLLNGTWLNVTIHSTTGDANEATWDVEFCDVATIQPANIEMVNVEQVWNNLDTSGTRRYFRCDNAPTSLTGLAKSHFKGLSVHVDKFIFTHTNLGLITPNPNGKYLIADQLWDQKWPQATVDATLDTLHPGWAHPCSSQACGSFMAMGIQQAADGPGSRVSQIQILDIRMTRVNQAATLLGAIEIPDDGVNGVGMTKEAGPDGKYLVAGINGTTLNVYRSSSSSLITNGAPSVQFTRILQQTIEDSGPGLALVTQSDGAIYLFAMNADPGQDNNEVNLYKLDLQSTPTKCTRVGTKHMEIPGMSDSVTLLEEYAAVLGPLLVALLAEFGAPSLNSSLRWGKGLAITSPTTFEVYASDRNVLPLSQLPVIGSDKDFSVVTWTSDGLPVPDALFHGIRNADGSWDGFNDASGIQNVSNDNTMSACAGVGNELQALLVKNDGRVFHGIRKADGSWDGFNDASGIRNVGKDNTTAACAGVANELQALLVKNDGRVFHGIRKADGSWDGFNDASGIRNVGSDNDMAVCAGVGAELQVLLRKNDGKVFHAIRKVDGSWDGFNDASAIQNVGSDNVVVACAGVGNELHVLLRKTDGKVFHGIRKADGSWSGFNDASGIRNVGNDNVVVACAGVGNELQVLLRKTDGKVFHAIRKADGSWDGFNDASAIHNVGSNNSLASCAGVGNALQVLLRKSDT